MTQQIYLIVTCGIVKISKKRIDTFGRSNYQVFGVDSTVLEVLPGLQQLN